MGEKIIYLTFDDGPSEPYTSELLAVLKDFGANATFFVCGQNVEKFPHVIGNIAKGGHAIGNHTYSHSFIKLFNKNILLEIDRTSALIEEHAGSKPSLYRSPWGLTMPWVRKDIEDRGYKIFHWDIMAFDWWQLSPNFIAKLVINRAYPGAIILLHDGDQVTGKSRSNTVAAVRLILQGLTNRGYTFKRLVS